MIYKVPAGPASPPRLIERRADSTLERASWTGGPKAERESSLLGLSHDSEAPNSLIEPSSDIKLGVSTGRDTAEIKPGEL